MSIRKDEQVDYKLSNLRSYHSISESLRKYVNIKEIWMVENGGSDSKKYEDEIDTYNVFSFKDFSEVLQTLNPNIVIGFGGNYEYLERSMIKSAASKGIPTVTVLGSFIETWVASTAASEGLISGRLHALRDHGKNIVRKYLFLLRTLRHSGYSLRYVIWTIIKDLYLPLISYSPLYAFGGGDLNVISTPQWADMIIKKGIPKDQVIVTGDCSMDSVHAKINSSSLMRKNTNKIEVLLVTTPMVEHGYWKPRMREEAVTSVVNGIMDQFQNLVNLSLKIHPSTENLEIYKKMLAPIDSNIKIYQNADLIELLRNCDIVVSLSTSSAIFQALLVGKPVLMMNLFNEASDKNVYIKEKVVLECRTVKELVGHISNNSYKTIGRDELNAFIEKIFYKFDGKCSERAADSIFSLVSARMNK